MDAATATVKRMLGRLPPPPAHPLAPAAAAARAAVVAAVLALALLAKLRAPARKGKKVAARKSVR